MTTAEKTEKTIKRLERKVHHLERDLDEIVKELEGKLDHVKSLLGDLVHAVDTGGYMRETLDGARTFLRAEELAGRVNGAGK